MSQLKQAGRKERSRFPLPLPFVLCKPSTEWTMPAHTGEGDLPSPPIYMLISWGNTLTDTLRTDV